MSSSSVTPARVRSARSLTGRSKVRRCKIVKDLIETMRGHATGRDRCAANRVAQRVCVIEVNDNPLSLQADHPAHRLDQPDA